MVPTLKLAVVGRVRLPFLSTENLLTPATCKSINLLPEALAVSVMFSYMPVKPTALLFHICDTDIPGIFCVNPIAPESAVNEPAVMTLAFAVFVVNEVAVIAPPERLLIEI